MGIRARVLPARKAQGNNAGVRFEPDPSAYAIAQGHTKFRMGPAFWAQECPNGRPDTGFLSECHIYHGDWSNFGVRFEPDPSFGPDRLLGRLSARRETGTFYVKLQQQQRQLKRQQRRQRRREIGRRRRVRILVMIVEREMLRGVGPPALSSATGRRTTRQHEKSAAPPAGEEYACAAVAAMHTAEGAWLNRRPDSCRASRPGPLFGRSRAASGSASACCGPRHRPPLRRTCGAILRRRARLHCRPAHS
jgi:hypothetical protein